MGLPNGATIWASWRLSGLAVKRCPPEVLPVWIFATIVSVVTRRSLPAVSPATAGVQTVIIANSPAQSTVGQRLIARLL